MPVKVPFHPCADYSDHINWCDDNCRAKVVLPFAAMEPYDEFCYTLDGFTLINRFTHQDKLSFHFEDPNEAMLFKLTFG